MIDVALALLAATAGQRTSGTAITVHCSGGVAGINRMVRLAPDGRLSRSERGDSSPRPAGRISSAEARALVDRLDKVSFATLTGLPRNSRIRDGIDCSITRTGPRAHSVQLPAGGRPAKADDRLRYREVSAVMSALFIAAGRAHLNPQPIPPVDVPVK